MILRSPQNEKGQMTMEMVLIMSALMAVSILAMRLLRDKHVASSLVEGPWQPVRGMIENGVWNGNAAQARTFHPSMKSRHATAEGNPIPQE